MRDLGKPDRITARKWRRLAWRDPRADLVNLGLLYAQWLRHGVLLKHDDLRERSLKRFLEQKQAALFAHLIGEAILKAPIAYAMVEDEDYDCVLWFKVDGRSRYSRVQLKEVVPPAINPDATIDGVLSDLGKYPTSGQTLVAVHVNQQGPLDLASIAKPETAFAEVWLYWADAPDQSRWCVYGNLLYQPRGFVVPWPTGYRRGAGGGAAQPVRTT